MTLLKTVLNLMLRLLLLPVAVIVIIMKWLGIFLTSFAGAILYILSGVCFLIAVLSYLMKISTGSESATMLLTGLVVFILPQIAGWMIGKLDILNTVLWSFVRA
ncbi:MAG: CD1845 family protein [Lachnospiraceae bacterium]|nr:CD1845 family protein [Lachnospiraceae bacterium]